MHRKTGLRVADLAYALGGEEIGRVRCDGLVVATPAGSTGYNLANGGPVLAWGVEGYVVSFIAPHSLTARRARGRARRHADGVATAAAPSRSTSTSTAAPAFELPAGEDITVEFGRNYAQLAQLPGASFYQRFRERFGRLAA